MELYMFDFLRWNKVKMDAAPGSLIYAGKKHDFKPCVSAYTFSSESFTESVLGMDDPLPLKDECNNFFIVTGVHESEFVKRVGASLSIPDLYLEDVLNTGQRSKLAWLDNDMGFIVAKNIRVEHKMLVHEQVSLFWGHGMVTVFLEDESDLLSGVLARLRKGKGRIRRKDSTYLMVAILDAIVDHHMMALASFSEAAQELEGKLAGKVADDHLSELYELKREIILLRNTLMPIREIFKSLLREDSDIPSDVLPYLQDVVGHHEQTLEGAASLHDILKSMIDYQISLIGIRTNKTMQFLTVIATVFIPLTFIAGVYGMNFKNMPELEWEYGYFIILGSMVVIGCGMLWCFVRKRYL